MTSWIPLLATIVLVRVLRVLSGAEQILHSFSSGSSGRGLLTIEKESRLFWGGVKNYLRFF